MLDGPATPALEKYREARAALANLDLEQRKGGLLKREDVHVGLARISAIIRQAGDTLQRLFGADAHAVKEIENLFGDSASEEHPDPNA
jgi:hypothetical protein